MNIFKFSVTRGILVLIATVSILHSCKKKSTETEEQENDNTEEIIEVNVKVELPAGSSISADNLLVSTLFTDRASITKSEGKVKSFDANSTELCMATNSQGNIIQLSYFNPTDKAVVLNTHNTAMAMIMMHPWTFDLTLEAKIEAVNYIATLSEFTDCKKTIENSLISGNINPLAAINVIDAVVKTRNKAIRRKLDVYKKPLRIEIENSTAKVINTISSATYCIGLYDEDDKLVEHKLAEGQKKTHKLYSDFTGDNFFTQDQSSQIASFNIPKDGEWMLKAKNGLSFDGSKENNEAAYANMANLTGDVIGLFSSKLKTLVKNGACISAIGKYMYNGVDGGISISNSLKAFKQKNITGFDLVIDVATFFSSKTKGVFGLVKQCNPSTTDKMSAFSFDQFGAALKVVKMAEVVFNSTSMVTDWIQFDSEIEFCFTKKGNDIEECLEDLEIGDFYKGGVIFYLDNTTQHGLVCASSDQGSWIKWGCQGTAISGADGRNIGAGMQNTIDIEAGCSTSGTAADLCSKLILNGFSDWFLPSHDELDKLLYAADAIDKTALLNGGTAIIRDRQYWSSTELSADKASAIRYRHTSTSSNGYSNADKEPGTTGFPAYVRAVRAF